MSKTKSAYNVGDLVQFKHNHLKVTSLKTGLVIGHNTNNNRFKVKVNKKDYWVSEDKIKLLSKAAKGASK
jgi:hypothetical protein